MFTYILYLRCVKTVDDIFSEFLSYGSESDAMPLIPRSSYICMCSIFTIFLIFFSYKFKKSSIIALFLFYLIQLQAYIFNYFPLRIKNSGFIYLSTYIILSLVSILLGIYFPFILISSLFHHSYLTYDFIIYFKPIYSHFISTSLYLLSLYFSYINFNLFINLVLLYYSSFFIVVLIKLLILDKLKINCNIRTRNRFNFKKDWLLLLIFIIGMVVNYFYQAYMKGYNYCWTE